MLEVTNNKGVPRTGKNSCIFETNPNRFLRFGREFAWIGSGQALATLGSLIGVRLLTGVLSPDVYGELALGMTLSTLLNQVVLGPLSGAALRFFAPALEASESLPFLTALRRLVIKATSVVLVISVSLSMVFVLSKQGRWLGLAITALGYALLSGYNSILNGLQNAVRQRIVVAWHQAFYSWARYLTALGVVSWLSASSFAAMLGYTLSTLLVLSSQFWFSRRTLQRIDKIPSKEVATTQDWESRMFTYAWPFATWGVFTWAQMASDRWALQAFATTQDVGLYSVLYQLGYYPTTLLTGLMVQLVAPMLFQRAGDASNDSRMHQVRTLNRTLTVGALSLTVITATLAFFLHTLIFQWLAAPSYRAVSRLLPGMVLAGGLYATGQFAALSVLSGVDTRSLIAPKIVTAVIGVLLNVIGASFWGISGVVASSTLAAIVYLVWVMCLGEAQRNQPRLGA